MKLLGKQQFVVLLTIALAHFSFGQDDDKRIYTVRILEINSEESLKNNDFNLRPLFDVTGTFNSENQTITYVTSARLKSTDLEAKLLLNDLHLTFFEAGTFELNNASKN